MNLKQIPETIIDNYVEALKTLSPDDARAFVIDDFEKNPPAMPDMKRVLAGLISSLFGGAMGMGLSFDQAREVFHLALANVDVQEHVFRSLEAGVKDLRDTANQ